MTIRALKDAVLKRTLPAALGIAATLLAGSACTSPGSRVAQPTAATFSASGVAHAKANVAVFETPTSVYPIHQAALRQHPGIGYVISEFEQ